MTQQTLVLTEEQLKVNTAIIDAATNKVAEVIVVEGGGGVGKTTSVFSALAELEGTYNKRIVTCAPTHKAVNVLNETARKQGMEFPSFTLASLLGYRVLPEDGKKVFKPEAPSRLDNNKYDVLLVDEGSQVNEYVKRHLIRECMRNRTTLIVMGDGAQIPPVKSTKSPLLEAENKHFLTTVHRYQGDILEMATELRKFILPEQYGGTAWNPDKPMDKYPISDLGKYLNNEDGSIISLNRRDLVQHYMDNMDRNDPDRAVILCWRNATVKEYNREIHELIHGANAPDFVVGDIVVPQSPVESMFGAVNTEEPCFIRDIVPSTYDMLDLGKVIVNTWELTLESFYTGEQVVTTAVQDSDLALYKDAMNEIAQMCRAGEVYWSQFWEIDNMFTEIRHTYARTSHKAQGSTFHSAYIDLVDMVPCREQRTFNRMLYTAITRPSNNLIIRES